MTALTSRFLSEGAFFLVIFLSGLWMSRTGNPYSTLILTIHKLIGLTALGYLIVAAYRLYQVGSLSQPGMAAVLVMVLVFVSLIATGGLLSANIDTPEIVSTAHKGLPYMALLSTAATIYLIS